MIIVLDPRYGTTYTNREPPMLTHATKNFSYWKRVMTNYMKLIEVWEAVENGFTPVYNSTTNIITT